MLQTVCINLAASGIRRHPRERGRIRSFANRLQEAEMRTPTVPFRAAAFTQKMTEMRMWLDVSFFEPIRFTYKQDREIIVISVDFPEDHHAEAFQSRFCRSAG